MRLAYVTECRSDVRSFSSPLSPFTVIEPEGRVNVELLPGEDLECDWYNILQDTPGTITLIKYWCQGNVVNAENCEIFIGGIAFTLIPQDGGEEIPLLTGNDGMATTEAEGVYEVVEDDFEWCSAQSGRGRRGWQHRGRVWSGGGGRDLQLRPATDPGQLVGREDGGHHVGHQIEIWC